MAIRINWLALIALVCAIVCAAIALVDKDLYPVAVAIGLAGITFAILATKDEGDQDERRHGRQA